MATLLQALITGPALPFIIFLLVFILLYALFMKTKLIGSEGLTALISFIIALFISTNKYIVKVLAVFLPWYTMFLIIGFFILLIIAVFGGNFDNLGQKKGIIIAAIALAVIILLFSLIHVFKQGIGERLQDVREELPGGANYSNSSIPQTWQEDFVRTFFHPNFLGVLFIFLFAGLLILFITREKLA